MEGKRWVLYVKLLVTLNHFWMLRSICAEIALSNWVYYNSSVTFPCCSCDTLLCNLFNYTVVFAAVCLLLLWAFSFFFFFPLQFCNLNKSIEVYLTWSNPECVLLWAVFLRNFLLQFCIHKSSLLCVKMRGRIIPYAPLTAVDFLCV